MEKYEYCDDALFSGWMLGSVRIIADSGGELIDFGSFTVGSSIKSGTSVIVRSVSSSENVVLDASAFVWPSRASSVSAANCLESGAIRSGVSIISSTGSTRVVNESGD